jgi:hypothetical protein
MKLCLRTALSRVVVTSIGATAITFLSFKPADAVIFVEPLVTTANQDILATRNPRRLTDIQPGQVIEYGVPDFANNLLNATGNNIGSFVFDLETLAYSNPNVTPAFNNEPVEWGDVNGDGKIGYSTTPGLTDIFKDVTVTGNRITFSGGEISNGEIFYNPFSSKPDLRPGGGIIPPAAPPPADQDGPIRVASYYTAIPEPTSIFALFFAVGGAVTIKRNRLTRKT